ncbi:hypothetical protein [Micromonospora chalcea]|uniref:hypothetical protein n=1 Tax=Micromonospora chalcea TaxID=1874 RepID=UPI003D762ED4
MPKFVVTTLRTERISYEVDAVSKEDAEARYLMDGEEVVSETTSTEIESVDEGSADEVLG